MTQTQNVHLLVFTFCFIGAFFAIDNALYCFREIDKSNMFPDCKAERAIFAFSILSVFFLMGVSAYSASQFFHATPKESVSREVGR